MKIIILVVTMFNYNADGTYGDTSRREYIQDSMAECQVAMDATMQEYYDHQHPAEIGIMAMCRRKRVNSDG